MNELPLELQSEYFLDLPSYCQSHQSAARLCRSESFWNKKAIHQFNLPLNLVDGLSPAVRYQILERVMNPDGFPVKNAFFHNQPRLLRALRDLQEDDLHVTSTVSSYSSYQ